MEHAIREVVITGCATDFYVDATIKAAASREYFVLAPGDGHATADRPSLSAEQVMDYHNWVWRNLILPKRNVKVFPTKRSLEYVRQKP